MEIKRSGSQPSAKGPAEWFTGTVRIDPLFDAPLPARANGASVTFEPGARTAWHTHPLGQTLIVTSGAGRAQRWGGPVEEIRPGDVVWIPPGEKHWHGAAPTTAMTHIAIQEKLDGKAVDWLEHVTAEQYRRTFEPRLMACDGPIRFNRVADLHSGTRLRLALLAGSATWREQAIYGQQNHNQDWRQGLRGHALRQRHSGGLQEAAAAVGHDDRAERQREALQIARHYARSSVDALFHTDRRLDAVRCRARWSCSTSRSRPRTATRRSGGSTTPQVLKPQWVPEVLPSPSKLRREKR